MSARSRFSWWRWVAVSVAGAVVAFAIGYFVAVFLIFPPTASAKGGTPVPRIIGNDPGMATRRLAAVGLVLGDSMPVPSAAEPPGVILAQSPLPGQEARPGTRVRVALSSGPPRALLPDVRSLDASKAAPLLTSLGFEVQQRPVESLVAVGRVLQVNPTPGAEYTLPVRVTLTVSAGPPPPPDTTAVTPDSAAVVQ